MPRAAGQAMTRAARVHPGVPNGGEFTTVPKAEPDVLLEASRDKDGFPTIPCPRCSGTGSSKYSSAQNHSRCYTCGGTGVTYSPGRVMDAVKAYAQARVDSSRPRVRQLRAGDVISPVYRTPGEANWSRVAQVLIFPARPTKTSAPGGASGGSTEFTAVIQFVDGTHMPASTDTVVARRGDSVDPEPFVARALGRRAVRKIMRRRATA